LTHYSDELARSVPAPSTGYLVSCVAPKDRTINPDLERFMAKRMGARTIEVNASHLALISQPDAITNLIMEALAV